MKSRRHRWSGLATSHPSCNFNQQLRRRYQQLALPCLDLETRPRVETAARSLYIESGGKDQEAYELIKQLLDAGPPMPDKAREEYLESLDAHASQNSNGD